VDPDSGREKWTTKDQKLFKLDVLSGGLGLLLEVLN
jgi:hypothetical protein